MKSEEKGKERTGLEFIKEMFEEAIPKIRKEMGGNITDAKEGKGPYVVLTVIETKTLTLKRPKDMDKSPTDEDK